VEEYDGVRKRQEKGVLVRFKPDEIKVLERCVKGELEPYKAAEMLGRSYDSVWTKMKRMKMGQG
jgi:hypothetical protein